MKKFLVIALFTSVSCQAAPKKAATSIHEQAKAAQMKVLPNAPGWYPAFPEKMKSSFIPAQCHCDEAGELFGMGCDGRIKCVRKKKK